MSAKRLAIVLILAGILLRLSLLLWAQGTMVDDAYISLRYADNLIHGKGLVYNEHSKVLSTTTPLYTLWMAFLLLVTPRVDPGYAIGMANLAFFGLAAWGLWTLCAPHGRRVSLFVLAFFAAYLRFVDNSVIGMETPLFLLLMVLSLLLLGQNRVGWSLFAAALSMLVRPEGALWALALLVVAVLGGVRPKVRHFVPGALVVAGWLIFSLYYYGSPIPHSLKAKSEWFVLWSPHGTLAGIMGIYTALTLMDLPRKVASAPLVRLLQMLLVCGTAVAFFFGTWQFIKRRSALLAFPLLFVFYVGFYLAGRGWVEFSWYGIPSGLAYIVTVVSGVAHLGRSLVKRDLPPSWVGAAGVILVAILAGSSIAVWQQTRLPYYACMRSSYERAGALVDELAEPQDRVFTTEAGMIGYRARRFVYDLGGVVSPEVLQLYRERSLDVPLVEIWGKYMPEFIVVTPRHMRRTQAEGGLQWLDANYEMVGDFTGHQVLRRRDLAGRQRLTG